MKYNENFEAINKNVALDEFIIQANLKSYKKRSFKQMQKHNKLKANQEEAKEKKSYQNEDIDEILEEIITSAGNRNKNGGVLNYKNQL